MKTYKPNEIISLLLDKSKKNGASDTEVIISKSYGKSLEVRNNVKEKIEEFKPFENPIKGEITVVLSNKVEKYNLDTSTFNEKKIKNEVKNYLKKYSLRDVVNLVAKKNNLS